MALLELKDFGVSRGDTRLEGLNLEVDGGSVLAVVGRSGEAISLLALAVAGLLPRGSTTTGTLVTPDKGVLYLDCVADASNVAAGAEVIVADEPGRERDPASQKALLRALQEASRTAAVVIFTTDFRLAHSMGLEVAVIAGGKLVLKALASEIAELPQHDAVRQMVGGEKVRTRTLMRPPIGEPVLELDGVTKRFRRGLPVFGPPPFEALSGVSFSVRQGESVGVLGLAGAGKSALLRVIAGLEAASAGRIKRRPGQVGFVFPDPRQAFNPALPVGVSLTEPLRVEQTLLIEEQADRLVEVVRAVGLQPDVLDRLPGAFGVAELQRLGLARALAGRPSLVLMDEPTATLDAAEAREFLVLMARVRADFGATAVIASREFEVMKAVTDRVLVLDNGKIVEGGKPGALGDAPTQEVTRRLVSARYPGPYEPPVEPAPVVEDVEAREAIEAAAPAGIAAIDRVLTEAAHEPALSAEVEPTPAAETTKDEPADPSPPKPVPEPVHGLSAQIVIAPVVLSDPVRLQKTAESAVEPATEPPSLSSHIPEDATATEPSAPAENEATQPPEPATMVPTPSVPAQDRADDAAPADPPEPEPEPAQVVPDASAHRADETAETVKHKRSVAGDIDAARSVEGR